MSSPQAEHVHGHDVDKVSQDLAQVRKDVNNERHRDLHKPRKLRFFVNGDRYFRGKKIYVIPNRYYNFNDLLNDLTGKLPPSLNLPHGVRQIFTPVDGRRIFNIEDLMDGETYVCAGFEGFKMIKYGRSELEPWSLARAQANPMTEQEPEPRGSYSYRGYAPNAFHPGRYYRTSHSYQYRRWPDTSRISPRAMYAGNVSESQQHRPKVITIIRNGSKPRRNVKMLLNRRAVQSYEQLVADISEAFGSSQRNSKVRKLLTLRGKEVMGVADFFREEDYFVAFGAEEPYPAESEFVDILGEFFPDPRVVKMILLEWKKNERRRKKIISTSQHNTVSKEENVTQSIAGQANPNQVQDKLDSGFDSIGASTNRSDPDQTDRRVAPRLRKRIGMKRGREKDPERNSDIENQPEMRETSPHRGHYVLKKVEKERLRLMNNENERTKRRHQNLIETEKRFITEHRRKRGLLPLRNIENPLKKSVGSKLKEEGKTIHKEEVRDGDNIGELEIQMEERGEKMDGTGGIRERVVRTEQNAQQKNTTEEMNGHEQEKGNERKSHSSVGTTAKPTECDASRTHTAARDTTKEQTVVIKESAPTDSVQTLGTTAAASVYPSTQEETYNNSNTQQQKEKRKPDKDDPQQRMRPKAKIVRKTKTERQVSGDEYVLALYELGRKLGDGNFAIVRQSRRKETGQEFAVKIIDKAKLKGKDHMIENEIDILKDCNHQNIVRLYEEYETLERIYLVMELVKGGDLFDAITQNVKFGETESALMVKDLCNALFYMHSRSIVHRDIKPENLLVHRNRDGGITLKLADFGLAMEVKDVIYTVCGTPTYVAPEILTESGYGLEVDMWAVGVITYILLCGFPPFRSPDRKQTELFEFIKAGHFEFLSPYWDNISRSAKDLISRLLVVDKKRRYSTVDVLCHRWILCGAQTDVVPNGALTIDAAIRQARRELEVQSQLNYESYQRLKEKKKQDWIRKEE